jgi:signal transduction histidine kinase
VRPAIQSGDEVAPSDEQLGSAEESLALESFLVGLEDLRHQLVTTLVLGVRRLERILDKAEDLSWRTTADIRTALALCRRAERLTTLASAYGALGVGFYPTPQNEQLSARGLLHIVVTVVEDAILLLNPADGIQIIVDRSSFANSVGTLGVVGDALFVEQCVAILVENACTCSYPDTKIRVRAAEKAGDYLVEVGHLGSPVSAEGISRWSEYGYRGISAFGRASAESGIGLSVVANLLKAMNGTLRVRSEGHETIIALVLRAQ